MRLFWQERWAIVNTYLITSIPKCLHHTCAKGKTLSIFMAMSGLYHLGQSAYKEFFCISLMFVHTAGKRLESIGADGMPGCLDSSHKWLNPKVKSDENHLSCWDLLHLGENTVYIDGVEFTIICAVNTVIGCKVPLFVESPSQPLETTSTTFSRKYFLMSTTLCIVF